MAPGAHVDIQRKAAAQAMTRKIVIDGAAAWRKSYERSPRARRLITALWNRLTLGLGVRPLCSPPRLAGDKARQLEERRIGELRRRGVHVPDILGRGDRWLVLSDIGPSLSSCLKRADDPAAVDRLVHRSAAALVAVHRSGGYLGQAVARNIVVSERDIGFIDFEEDPLAVMSLDQAQARDWLLFSSSVARYYEDRVETLAGLFGGALAEVGTDVAARVDETAGRLGFLVKLTRTMGRRARALGVAVASLRGRYIALIVGMVLLADFVSDGDWDILMALQQML
jgi:tRNA A-37 threonylcarbamoyl transferase component Bud32